MLSSVLLIIIPTAVISLYSAMNTVSQIAGLQKTELYDRIELIEERVRMTKSFTDEVVMKDLEILESKLNELGGLNVTDQQTLLPVTGFSVAQTAVDSLLLDNEGYERIEQVLLELTGQTGAFYTIFQPFNGGIIRVATSIRNKDGVSARGTFIGKDSGVYTTVDSRAVYYGRAVVLGEWYSTVYKPVFSDDGRFLFVLFSGKPESLYFKSLFAELSEKVIGNEGYYYILDSEGNYILSFQNKRNGENIIDSVDQDGNRFIAEMISSAVTNPGISIMKYPWMNGQDRIAREKIAAFTYYSELDWVIGASDYIDRSNDMVFENLKIQALIILVCLILGMTVSIISTSLIFRSFNDLKNNIDFVSRGDFLTVTGRDSGFKDIFELQRTIRNNLVPMLTALISEVNEKSGQIILMSEILEFNINQSLESVGVVNRSSATVKSESEKLNSLMDTSKESTEAIVSSIHELKNMVSEQSSSVTEISAAIEESNASLMNVSRVVQEKMDNAAELVKQGESGRKNVEGTNGLITGVRNDVNLLFEVIDIINSITEQSKLLAMNAAIEAAHAGEKGRGFAIVAGEMRQLANTTSENGVRISETLKSVLQRIETASRQSAETLSIIDRVNRDITLFTDAFREIANSTAEISAGTTQILEAANLLSDLSENTLANSDSINDSVLQLSGAVGLTAASSRKNREEIISLMAAMDEMVEAQNEMKSLGYLNTSMGNELSDSLNMFKYRSLGRSESTVLEMIRAHQLWVERVEKHLSGSQKLDVHSLGDHNSCALGRWINSDSAADLKNLDGFARLLDYHEDLHRVVSGIVGAGDSQESDTQANFIRLKSLSHYVIRHLLELILN